MSIDPSRSFFEEESPYAYVANNPANLIDPSGRIACPCPPDLLDIADKIAPVGKLYKLYNFVGIIFGLINCSKFRKLEQELLKLCQAEIACTPDVAANKYNDCIPSLLIPKGSVRYYEMCCELHLVKDAGQNVEEFAAGYQKCFSTIIGFGK